MGRLPARQPIYYKSFHSAEWEFGPAEQITAKIETSPRLCFLIRRPYLKYGWDSGTQSKSLARVLFCGTMWKGPGSDKSFSLWMVSPQDWSLSGPRQEMLRRLGSAVWRRPPSCSHNTSVHTQRCAREGEGGGERERGNKVGSGAGSMPALWL